MTAHIISANLNSVTRRGHLSSLHTANDDSVLNNSSIRNDCSAVTIVQHNTAHDQSNVKRFRPRSSYIITGVTVQKTLSTKPPLQYRSIDASGAFNKQPNTT